MSQVKKGAILSYVSIALTNIIGLVLTPYIVKSLGNSEYGLYSLIGALVGYLTIMDLGLNNTIVRYVSKYRAEQDAMGERRFLGAVMMIYGVISMAVLVVGLVLYFNVASFFGDTLTSAELEKAKIMMVILIGNLMISLPGGSFIAICNAYEYFVFPRALNIVKYLLRSLLVYVILKMGADSVGLVILDTVVNVAAILISFVYVLKKMKVSFVFRGIDKTMFKNIFSYSVWIFLFAIVSQIQWKGGQFVIGAQLDTESVAVFAIGIMLGTYYGAFSGAISNLFLPRATQMAVHNATGTELTQMMVKIARYSMFSLMIIFIGFFFFGQQFIRLWLDESYDQAYYIALLIMLGYTVPLVQTFANSLLEAKKLFKFKGLVYLVSLGLGIVLSYVFVQEHGILSVALWVVGFWVLGQIIMNVFYSRALHLQIGMFFKELSKGLWLVFLLTMGAGYLITLIPLGFGWNTLVIKGVLLITFYSGMLYIIGMRKEERAYLLSIFKRK